MCRRRLFACTYVFVHVRVFTCVYVAGMCVSVLVCVCVRVCIYPRVNARLMLLPPHDPQFRRNKERVNRDAERELISLDWDLGDDENANR